MLKRFAALLLFPLLMLLPLAATAESSLAEETQIIEIEESVLLTDDGEEIILEPETVVAPEVVNEAREDLIDRIIALGEELYEKAGGKAQRAHYASDIYVCKNFTTYLFRKCRDDFRMAEYPDVTLVVPDNMPAKQCKPYSYGLMWKDVPASEGNAFYAAAEFRYDTSLTYDENLALAEDFMREAKRGDYFQMSAEYEYGTGAHSAIIIADWDPETDTIHWMDSNMRGKKVNGIRYGIVQFNEEKPVSWWAACFCKKTRGATLYRLRDDIVYASEVAN